MGLDLSHGTSRHDEYHYSYGTLNIWRDRLAAAAGWPMHRMDRDGRERPVVDWALFTEDNLYGEWPNGAPAGCDDPLIFLIAHSDCEGVIHPEQGRHLLLRLRELAPKIDEGDKLAEAGRRFIGCLERAVAAGEPLEFY